MTRDGKKKWIRKYFGTEKRAAIYFGCLSLTALSFLFLAYKDLFLTDPKNIPDFFTHAIYLLCVALILTLPVFIQKWYRIYIPSFLQIIFSCYFTLRAFVGAFYIPKSGLVLSFLPFAGGLVFSMTLFSVVYSVACYRAEKYHKTPSAFRSAALTALASALFILTGEMLLFLLKSIRGTDFDGYLRDFIFETGGHLGGILVYCSIGWYLVKKDRAEGFMIRTASDIEGAKAYALRAEKHDLYAAIRSDEKYPLQRQSVAAFAKEKYLFIKIVYFLLYAGYAATIFYNFFAHKIFSLVQPIMLALFLVFSLSSSIYEYKLYKAGGKSRKLYLLKVCKCYFRIVYLGLSLSILFSSDQGGSVVSIVYSIAMSLLNFGLLLYDIVKIAAGKKSGREQEDNRA